MAEKATLRCFSQAVSWGATEQPPRKPPASQAPSHPLPWPPCRAPDPVGKPRRGGHLHGIGGDQQVSVVKQCDPGHLDDEHVYELNGQHEHQLPNAADLQEHGAGQQAEQHAVGEVLRTEGSGLQRPGLASPNPGLPEPWPWPRPQPQSPPALASPSSSLPGLPEPQSPRVPASPSPNLSLPEP